MESNFYMFDILNKCLLFENLNKDECPVLLKPYKYGFVLPCNHFFSATSIIEWIRHYNITCPLCRTCIINDGDKVS